MKEKAALPKVTRDMFLSQLNWTAGFIVVILIISIIKTIIDVVQGNDVEGFFSTIFISGNIYMLIIGILAIYFLPYFVGNGISRKNFFFGGLLASIGLSVVIPIIALVLSFLEQLLFKAISIDYKVQVLNEIDFDESFVAVIVQSIILPPHIDPESNLIAAIAVLALNIFMYYLLGWLISASFYRFDTVTGIVFIVGAIVLKMMHDAFLRIILELPVYGLFSMLDPLPLGIAVVAFILIFLIPIGLIRLLTRKVAVKL